MGWKDFFRWEKMYMTPMEFKSKYPTPPSLLKDKPLTTSGLDRLVMRKPEKVDTSTLTVPNSFHRSEMVSYEESKKLFLERVICEIFKGLENIRDEEKKKSSSKNRIMMKYAIPYHTILDRMDGKEFVDYISSYMTNKGFIVKYTRDYSGVNWAGGDNLIIMIYFHQKDEIGVSEQVEV